MHNNKYVKSFKALTNTFHFLLHNRQQLHVKLKKYLSMYFNEHTKATVANGMTTCAVFTVHNTLSSPKLHNIFDTNILRIPTL